MSFTFMSIAVQWMTLDAKQKTKKLLVINKRFCFPSLGEGPPVIIHQEW